MRLVAFADVNQMWPLGGLPVGGGMAGDAGLRGEERLAAVGVAPGLERIFGGHLLAERGDHFFGVTGGCGNLDGRVAGFIGGNRRAGWQSLDGNLVPCKLCFHQIHRVFRCLY